MMKPEPSLALMDRLIIFMSYGMEVPYVYFLTYRMVVCNYPSIYVQSFLLCACFGFGECIQQYKQNIHLMLKVLLY